MHMRNPSEILGSLLLGEKVNNQEYLILKEKLKPIFFRDKGFMAWARSTTQTATKEKILNEGKSLIRDNSISADTLIENFASKANELNQGAQEDLLYSSILSLFPKFKGNDLSKEHQSLIQQLKSALNSTQPNVREKAILIIATRAELSNGQSRKSLAGAAAEQAIELLLTFANLKKGIDYGTQFIYQGSNTDFIVPYADRGKVHDVRAFIAVQSSTNDRARLSSSELHRGAKRYLCSLNGCSSSSKDTTDIGNDLAAGYLDNETYYVVVEKERLKAVQDAKKRYAQSIGTPSESNTKKRLRWLLDYSINYDEFLRQIEEITME